MSIVLFKTSVIEDVPKMIHKGSCTILENGVSVLDVMHTTFVQPLGSGSIIFGNKRYANPRYALCISDDGIYCLVVSGKNLNNSKIERTIIPLE